MNVQLQQLAHNAGSASIGWACGVISASRECVCACSCPQTAGVSSEVVRTSESSAVVFVGGFISGVATCVVLAVSFGYLFNKFSRPQVGVPLASISEHESPRVLRQNFLEGTASPATSEESTPSRSLTARGGRRPIGRVGNIKGELITA